MAGHVYYLPSNLQAGVNSLMRIYQWQGVRWEKGR